MHKTAVGYALGKLLQVMGVVLLLPLGIALWDNRGFSLTSIWQQQEVFGFVVAIALSTIIGSFFVLTCRGGRDLQFLKEGYAIVTLGWLGLAFVSAIPLHLYMIDVREAVDFSSQFLAFTDAYFEVMSGLTTTGATILTDVEALPRSLLFLRALTHWLGGMGIITLAIVIFPAMGVFGYSMFKGEVPGPSKDRLRPRLAQTASILWGVYLLLTAVETVALMGAGMGWFDAICHSFATMATGGFSTKNASVAGYNSDAIEWIITIFMYFAGINFLLHFRAIRGDFQTLTHNKEFRFYTGVILVTILISSSVLYLNGLAPESIAAESYRSSAQSAEEFSQHYEAQSEQLGSVYDALRIASFQTVAIVTTTGFATHDFDLWPDFLRFTLVFLMFFGGCAGSTGGGMKIIRVMLLFKVALNTLRKMTQPRLVSPIKLGGEVVEEATIVNVVAFFILFVGLFVVVGALMTLFVPDLTTAVTCSIATIGNIGPGLGGIGAVENYSWIPIPGKWLLVISMLLGRLEIFTVLIILRPAIWRK